MFYQLFITQWAISLSASLRSPGVSLSSTATARGLCGDGFASLLPLGSGRCCPRLLGALGDCYFRFVCPASKWVPSSCPCSPSPPPSLLSSSVMAPESPPSTSPVWGRCLISDLLGLSALGVFSFSFVLKSNYLTSV